MTMINSKKKGAAGEREFANYCKAMGFDVRRTAQYNGKELDSKADVIGIPGIHIEVKRTERLNLYDALAQSKHDAGEDIPVVMHRKNDCEWVVIQPLKDWINLYREWEMGRQ